ncbi:hypothetical protein [Ornithinimicrobium panacihumi]|uniref:hypothetical protein n=1 Tax=Ornithinimicrobium panacihumi TaxID=2008449 RepID=UPI003F8AA91C
MQTQRHVTVAEVDADGTVVRVSGTAALVAPDVAVMRVVNRETVPVLPLVVLVPVAAGGGKDEHHTTPVSEVAPAVDGRPYVALRLAEQCDPGLVDRQESAALERMLTVEPGVGTTARDESMDLDPAASLSARRENWLCRIFRIC